MNNDSKIKILNEKVVESRIIGLNVEDVEKLYRFEVDVQFVPYEGTILLKRIKSIVRKSDNVELTTTAFAKDVALLLGYNNIKVAETKIECYVYWNKDGDIEWHDTLAKGVREISIRIDLPIKEVTEKA